MLPSERAPPSGNYLVKLNGDIDVQGFIERLRDDIKEQVTGHWSVGTAKGIIGTSVDIVLHLVVAHSQVVQVVSTRVLAVSSPPTLTWCLFKKTVKATRGSATVCCHLSLMSFLVSMTCNCLQDRSAVGLVRISSNAANVAWALVYIYSYFR